MPKHSFEEPAYVVKIPKDSNWLGTCMHMYLTCSNTCTHLPAKCLAFGLFPRNWNVFFACWYLSLPLIYTYLFDESLWRLVKRTAFMRYDVERHLLFPSCNINTLSRSLEKPFLHVNKLSWICEGTQHSKSKMNSIQQIFNRANFIFLREPFRFRITHQQIPRGGRERNWRHTFILLVRSLFHFISISFFISNFVCVTKVFNKFNMIHSALFVHGSKQTTTVPCDISQRSTL